MNLNTRDYNTKRPELYRHTISNDFNNSFGRTLNSNLNNFYQTNYSISRKDNFNQLQDEKLKNYEKLLGNLDCLSNIMNNFFHIFQGTLGMNIDTIFTDYSYTNIIEIDKRLQDIIKKTMKKLNL